MGLDQLTSALLISAITAVMVVSSMTALSINFSTYNLAQGAGESCTNHSQCGKGEICNKNGVCVVPSSQPTHGSCKAQGLAYCETSSGFQCTSYDLAAKNCDLCGGNHLCNELYPGQGRVCASSPGGMTCECPATKPHFVDGKCQEHKCEPKCTDGFVCEQGNKCVCPKPNIIDSRGKCVFLRACNDRQDSSLSISSSSTKPDKCPTCTEDPSLCTETQKCVDGQCVSKCEGVTCEVSGQICNPSTGTCGCSPGQTTCGNPPRCVDTSSDSSNCGTCGNVCTGGEQCRNGSCLCPSGQNSCNGQCTDTSTDSNNCGSCGNVCPSGQSCSNGSCQLECPEGQTTCGNPPRCVDTSSDSSNCGTCGNVCTGGQTCQSSVCRCPAGQRLCSGKCVDIQTDLNNCGGCGRSCPSALSGSICQAGTCVCAPDKPDRCGAICVNFKTDPKNCGGCGVSCDASQVCEAGACVDKCDPGLTYCNGECVDTNTDVNNCGECGNACGTAGHPDKLRCAVDPENPEFGPQCTCESEPLGAYERYQYCPNVDGSGERGCTDKASDDYNCGTSSCGNVCGTRCIDDRGVCTSE